MDGAVRPEEARVLDEDAHEQPPAVLPRGAEVVRGAARRRRQRSENARLVNVASMAGKLRQVSAARQRAFSDEALTTEALLGFAEEFAADVAAGQHGARGWGKSNYGFSKLCVIAYTKILARRFAGSGLRANCCCPGYCKTDMSSNRGPRPPAVGARNAAMLALPECALNGEFVQDEAVSAW